MATQTQVFDLYYLLVELIFGSILASWIGMSIIFMIIGFLSRTSPFTIFFMLGMFGIAMSVGYAGVIAIIPLFIGSFSYFTFQLVQTTMRFN
jgi:hypothetical protein